MLDDRIDKSPNNRKILPLKWLVSALLVAEGVFLAAELLGRPLFAQAKGWPILVVATSLGIAVILILAWSLFSLMQGKGAQFSLRFLLLMTLSVAMLCGWFVVEMNRAQRQRELVAELKQSGMGIYYPSTKQAGLTRQLSRPELLLEKMRGEYFADAVAVEPLTADPFGSGKALPKTLDGDKMRLMIEAAPNAKRIALTGMTVTEDGMTSRNTLTELEHLDLSFTSITDAELERLTALRSLQSLNLSNTQITDAGLLHLKRLQNLKHLNLSNTQVLGTRLHELTNLDNVFLEATQVTDSALKDLADHKDLRSLDLSKTQITDAALEHLSQLSKLESLGLRQTRITDSGLLHLRNLTELKSLNLRDTKITENGLRHIADLRNVELLYLDCTQINDSGLEHLQNMDRLYLLTLDATHITEAGLKHLERLKNLKRLVVGTSPVSKDALDWLRDVLPNCKID